MFVAIMSFDLLIHESESLKVKRNILHKIKDKFFARFRFQLTETGDQELWNKARMGFAFVGSDYRETEKIVDTICRFLIEFNDSEVVNIRRDIQRFE